MLLKHRHNVKFSSFCSLENVSFDDNQQTVAANEIKYKDNCFTSVCSWLLSLTQ